MEGLKQKYVFYGRLKAKLCVQSTIKSMLMKYNLYIYGLLMKSLPLYVGGHIGHKIQRMIQIFQQ
jgi:hypothetical protein